MDTLDFLKQNLHLSNDEIKSAGSLTNLTEEIFNFKNDYIIRKSSNTYKKELALIREIARTTSSETRGFEDLINALSGMVPDSVVSMRFIESTHWDGRVFYDEKNTCMGVAIGKKKQNWHTPPNWDGSEEMLRTYNTKKDS
ncbi:hypothetical protein [Pseudomonas viridiflava]|uniref:hypothetical protein n=1 Tax=Pseudomonas viridiflava TaxID=33069 RepID=UPI001C2CE366|nr:hypothetical protein [Pseudomonas viridiflava]MBV1809867.1 hypothetical protein [Pseudomonas viridiflava]